MFAGTDGTVKQFKLKPGDIVNPILRPTRCCPVVPAFGVAYTSRAREIAAGEITGLRAFVTTLVDGMGIANAFVLRFQAILLPVKVLVFPG